VFDIPTYMVTPLMRTRAKAVNFGIVYGIGEYSLSQDIKVSRKQAKTYIDNYLNHFNGVADYMQQTIKNAYDVGYVTTLFGRRRYIPELKVANKNLKAFGERVAMNAPIQGTAADIIKIAMVKVYESLLENNLEAKLLLQVHDELLVECPKSEVEKVSVIIKREMEQAAKLSVPLTVEVNSGFNWLDAK
ncbi:MAG: DNA polymerase, partial [Clostridia bacterium]